MTRPATTADLDPIRQEQAATTRVLGEALDTLAVIGMNTADLLRLATAKPMGEVAEALRGVEAVLGRVEEAVTGLPAAIEAAIRAGVEAGVREALEQERGL